MSVEAQAGRFSMKGWTGQGTDIQVRTLDLIIQPNGGEGVTVITNISPEQVHELAFVAKRMLQEIERHREDHRDYMRRNWTG